MLSYRDTFKKILQCFEYLPGGNAPEYIILKGHLLVEEEMLNYLSRAMQNPIPLSKGRFSFFNLIHIAEAMRPKDKETWLWEALRHLNTLRNEMAHNLTPKKFAGQLKSLKQIVSRQAPYILNNSELSDEESLKMAITYIVCSLCSLPKGRQKY